MEKMMDEGSGPAPFASLTGQTLCVDGGSTLPESPVFLEELEGIKEVGGSSS